MAMIKRRSRQRYRKQGGFPPGAVEAVMALRDKFGQRDGETEAEWLARMQRQNIEFMAEMDRLAAEEEQED